MYFFFIFNFFSDFYQKRKIVVMKFFHNSINEAVLAPKMLSLAPASAALHRQCKEPTFDATTHSKTAKKPFFLYKILCNRWPIQFDQIYSYKSMQFPTSGSAPFTHENINSAIYEFDSNFILAHASSITETPVHF